MTETEAFIALNMIPRVGPVRLRRLLEALETPQGVLAAGSSRLKRIEGIGPEVAASIAGWEKSVDLAEEIRHVERAGVQVLTQAHSDYPRLLREIHDPPIVLYVRGDLAGTDRRAIGIVGTRKPTHYAAGCAKKLGYQLAYAGLAVVSGLARGVDTAAHQAALAAKGKTIAVLGSGLAHLYPPENADLADRIAETGAVITEFSMQIKADRQTFPMRNRIISGLSFGLLVVEAGNQSGALISATQAAEQGRSLYAVPGRIDQPNALGTNRLIQQGAKLVMSAQDILDDLGMLFPEKPELVPSPRALSLGPAERAVYDAIRDDDTLLDEIIAKCGLPTPEVSSTLLALEMKKLVKPLPGSRFVKLL